MNSTVLPTQPPLRFWTLANTFTFARFVLAPVCAYFYMQETLWGVWLAGWAAILAVFTDFCDGYFARRSRQVSDLGKIFDPLADAVFFVVVWTALGLTDVYPIWFALPFIAREFVQHVYLRPSAMRLGVVLAANFWGKTKTVTQTVVIILIWIFELILYRAPMIKPEVRIIEMVLIGITGAVSVLSILPYFGALRKASKAVN
jgi:CDP-diacylglycerol--glycerol-3-phosphate 3-phosphatidyltransferase